RRFLQALGAGSIAAAASAFGCRAEAPESLAGVAPPNGPGLERYPAPPNARFAAGVAPAPKTLTEESVAARYNNFYEFSGSKDDVVDRVRGFRTHPWSLTVDGLVEEPRTFAIDELVRAMPLEERVYRFRCVEAWAMVVPWTGFPLRALLERVRPRASARYLRFESFYRPSEASGQRFRVFYPWPYTEGLTLAEAMNELTFVATGIYGHPLPKQHGAPVRMAIPWKYGFKGAKSIVRITLTQDQPATFWNSISPDEYDFSANVNPSVPHPRWSQASERLLGSGERQPTLLYNGYAEWVAALYR
ncbi:MAG: protein-methionine-sulfoxide reductase catalytic subunit MsrP, partial [Deltaproteobacteria bacterium]